MHNSSTFIQQLTELLKVIIPLFASYLAYRRGTKAYRKAKAVEAACTFPKCGHVCASPQKS